MQKIIQSHFTCIFIVLPEEVRLVPWFRTNPRLQRLCRTLQHAQHTLIRSHYGTNMATRCSHRVRAYSMDQSKITRYEIGLRNKECVIKAINQRYSAFFHHGSFVYYVHMVRQRCIHKYNLNTTNFMLIICLLKLLIEI